MQFLPQFCLASVNLASLSAWWFLNLWITHALIHSVVRLLCLFSPSPFFLSLIDTISVPQLDCNASCSYCLPFKFGRTSPGYLPSSKSKHVLEAIQAWFQLTLMVRGLCFFAVSFSFLYWAYFTDKPLKVEKANNQIVKIRAHSLDHNISMHQEKKKPRSHKRTWRRSFSLNK